MAVVLAACALVARFSRKWHNPSASLLLAALIPPVYGNLITTVSRVQAPAEAGYLIFHAGMDLLMFALLRFTFRYCRIKWPARWIRPAVYALLAADAVQLLCNPVFRHAFRTERILVSGHDYYRMVPLAGQTFHRVVCYGIFLAVLMIFIYQTVHAPRLSRERYAVILLSLAAAGLLQTYAVYSRAPVDLSMIGFVLFGLLAFYFSAIYRPVRLLERMLSGIASNLADSLFFYDSEGVCIWANESAMLISSAPSGNFAAASDWLLQTFPDAIHPGAWVLHRTVGSGENARIYAIRKQHLTEGRSGIAGSFITLEDHTEEQREVNLQLYTARHDHLTGLYTRDYLYEQTRRLLNENPDTDYVVTYADFNDFKLVNDLFGSSFGDSVLRSFADFMRENLQGKNAVFGRLGGDTFGTCQPAAAFDPDSLARRLGCFQASDGGSEHRVQVHVGVFTVTERTLDVSVMYDRAHLALQSIKNNYHRKIAYYRDEMRASILWNQRISSELSGAIAREQIRPFLQPMVNRDGRIIGAEVLARWIHPKEGMLAPASFIPLLEKNGMITEVDRYIWRSACKILARWQKEGRGEFLSVNVSPRDFSFLDIPAELTGLVKEYGVDPAKLRIEITESIMMTDAESSVAVLKALRSAGFIIEMDDFGSGYSSLNMLKDMPVDVLKIDMVFLRKNEDTRQNRTIVRHIISMAHDLGIVSVSEGVETEDQFRRLSEMGCEIFQGYYFSRPVPPGEFESLLRNESPA